MQQSLKTPSQSFKALIKWSQRRFSEEQSQWILWAPVALGIGIGVYFTLSHEPEIWVGGVLILKAGLLWYLLHRVSFLRPITLALVLMALGFAAGQLRTWSLSTPFLQKKTEPLKLTGTVEKLERRPDKVLVTLTHLTSLTLPKVRIALRGEEQTSPSIFPGNRISLEAVLLPPSRAPSPEVYNFRKRAFFEGLSAVGYALQAPKILSEVPSWRNSMNRLRQSVNHHFKKEISGQSGAIAAALATGDRAGLEKKTRQAFADAGIAHILAISGLHMVIVAGLIFFIIRRGLCLIPSIALRYPTKKFAAFITILITGFYLILCWQSLPARRAFIMTTLVMIAILLDRTALSLRNVMFAAFCILLILPESLLSPSFQLSFAAVICLISTYEACHHHLAHWSYGKGFGGRVAFYFMGIVGTTLIATIATTPFTLFFFNQFTLHGIAANLAAIPLTTFWIMPLELLFLVLTPFGSQQFVAPYLEQGIGYLITIAERVSQWPFAVLSIPQLPLYSLIWAVIGGLWICLWKTKWRWGGFLLLLPIIYHSLLPIPTDLYVNAKSNLIAIRGMRALYGSSLIKEKFTMGLWQQHAGNLDLLPLWKHPDFKCWKDVCTGKINQSFLQIILPKASKYFKCRRGDLFINLKSDRTCSSFKEKLTKSTIQKRGGVLIRKGHLFFQSERGSNRPWG